MGPLEIRAGVKKARRPNKNCAKTSLSMSQHKAVTTDYPLYSTIFNVTMSQEKEIHQRHTLPHAGQNNSDQACYKSLALIAASLALSFPGLVRLAGLCSQVCPLASFQKAIFWDPGRTCSGPTPFLAVSYSAASAGYIDCSELQTQAFLLAQ